MKKFLKLILNIFKFALGFFLIEVSIIYASFIVFNRHCDLTDIIGYNWITDTTRFISHHFVVIVNSIILLLIILHQIKKHRD